MSGVQGAFGRMNRPHDSRLTPSEISRRLWARLFTSAEGYSSTYFGEWACDELQQEARGFARVVEADVSVFGSVFVKSSLPRGRYSFMHRGLLL
jgi:hypothetical protein